MSDDDDVAQRPMHYGKGGKVGEGSELLEPVRLSLAASLLAP